MAEVEILIEGEFKKSKYKSINPQLANVVREVFRGVVDSIEDKSKEFARGAKMPPQHVGNQAQHKIGKSESGYVLSGKLEAGIKTIRSPVRGHSFSARIKSTAPESSYLEFGTGVYGKFMQIIKPKKGQTLTFKTPKFGWVNTASTKGQRPNPFMRGAVWWTQDHIKEIAKKVQGDIRGKKVTQAIELSMTVEK